MQFIAHPLVLVPATELLFAAGYFGSRRRLVGDSSGVRALAGNNAVDEHRQHVQGLQQMACWDLQVQLYYRPLDGKIPLEVVAHGALLDVLLQTSVAYQSDSLLTRIVSTFNRTSFLYGSEIAGLMLRSLQAFEDHADLVLIRTTAT